jgi:hypothetical protein
MLCAGDEGCFTNSTRMKMTTMQGNNNTTPRGMDILEFPRSRNGRRKKAKPGAALIFSFMGSWAVMDGTRLMALRTTSIVVGMCQAD